MKIKKIAFTGQKGDIGSILFKKLTNLGLNCVNFNEDKSEIDILLHIAAKSPPSTSQQIIDSNIIYLQEIVKDAKANGVKGIIFFSSVSIYGDQNKELVTEDDPIITPSLYGMSKLIGEKYLSECGIPVLALRLPAVLGYTNKTNFMSRLYENCIQNKPVEIFNYDKLFNNLIDTNELVRFIVQLKFKKSFDYINLASALNLKIIDIVTMLVALTNSNSKIVLSDKGGNFFNLSTKKAESFYGFVPPDPSEMIINWISEMSKLKKDCSFE